MAFIKVVENFDCIHCGAHVVGTGFTNHCPHCLFSLHVDNDPGDRASTCRGIMIPIEGVFKGGTLRAVIQECNRCHHQHTNKLSVHDNQEVLIQIMKEQGERLLRE